MNELQQNNIFSKPTLTTPGAIIIGSVIIATAFLLGPVGSPYGKFGVSELSQNSGTTVTETTSSDSGYSAELEQAVLPSEGVILPVKWGDLGAQMVQSGVIDRGQFEALYAERGGMDGEMTQLLDGTNNGNLKLTTSNSGFVLNLLWALGLGNKNAILDNGPMTDKSYGGAGNFASTGGWSLAKGETMDHYSKHPFVSLTDAQQQLVENVSKNIYRPCCGNDTYFPDCNHGMAMLGLLELMASQGVSEDVMYKAALYVNSFWFPENYLTIAKYLETNGTQWEDADARSILGKEYSSSSGFQQIESKVVPPESKGSGGGCGV